MAHSIWLTIDWRDSESEVPEAQQEAFTQFVFQSLRSLSEVQAVDRVPDPDVPAGGMGAQWLSQILTLVATMGKLSDRLSLHSSCQLFSTDLIYSKRQRPGGS